MSDRTVDLQSILDRASRGDDGAYAELVSRASARLLKLTRRMFRGYPHLRRWEQTDDVFQSAAMRLYRSLHNVRPGSVREFFGLAALQIRRTLIDLARHHFGPEGDAAHHHSGDGQLPGNPVERAAASSTEPTSLEEWADFHAAIDTLPDDEREVFGLVWYSGMPQAEIAQLLGVSVPTVKRRWQRGRVLLNEKLRGESPETGAT